MTERVTTLVLAAALTLAAAPGAAETFRWVDPRGAVTYSDRPPQPHDITGAAPAPRAESEPPYAEPARPRSPVVTDAPAPRRGPATVDDLLELSGARAQLAGFAARLAAELRPRPGQMSAPDQRAAERILDRELRPEALYALVRSEFRRHLDRARLEAVVAWLETPLGRAITALEVAASEPAAAAALAEYARRLEAAPAPAARAELLERLDWVSGGGEGSVEIVAAIARSVAKAVAAVAPPERRLRPGQIERQVVEVKARVSAAVARQVLVSRLYTYRSLDDRQLEEYVRFQASEDGRWYNATMRKALRPVLDQVLGRTTLELVKAVPPERWAPAAAAAPAAR